MDFDLAKILENAPNALKLYSMAHGFVQFIQVVDDRIECLTCYKQLVYFTRNGELIPHKDAFCVYEDSKQILFPSKYSYTWNVWWRYLLQNGDCITYDGDRTYTAIYLGGDDAFNPITGESIELSCVDNVRFANAEDSLDAHLWNQISFKGTNIKFDQKKGEIILDDSTILKCIKKGENIDPSYLKAGDKVMGRCTESNDWQFDLYSHYDEKHGWYICVGGAYPILVPFNDSVKDIIGTNKQCPTFFYIIENEDNL